MSPRHLPRTSSIPRHVSGFPVSSPVRLEFLSFEFFVIVFQILQILLFLFEVFFHSAFFACRPGRTITSLHWSTRQCGRIWRSSPRTLQWSYICSVMTFTCSLTCSSLMLCRPNACSFWGYKETLVERGLGRNPNTL